MKTFEKKKQKRRTFKLPTTIESIAEATSNAKFSKVILHDPLKVIQRVLSDFAYVEISLLVHLVTKYRNNENNNDKFLTEISVFIGTFNINKAPVRKSQPEVGCPGRFVGE